MKAKPFVKWAGGKSWLLSMIESNLPVGFEERQAVTYVEPFVGGGAVLFYMIERHKNINKVIINDINPALVNCYNRIKDNHTTLISLLKRLQEDYYHLSSDKDKCSFYYDKRDEYNNIDISNRKSIDSAALFIFLNKTCFNGLYRENLNGKFNVPVGRMSHPIICDEQAILIAHEALQKVKILCGDYRTVSKHVDWNDYCFYYLDPPYRPHLGAKNFREYTFNTFGDSEQEELKLLCDYVNHYNGHFIVSNSDSEIEPNVSYFERLYKEYNIQRIPAPRRIGGRAERCQVITEILIKNY